MKTIYCMVSTAFFFIYRLSLLSRRLGVQLVGTVVMYSIYIAPLHVDDVHGLFIVVSTCAATPVKCVFFKIFKSE